MLPASENHGEPAETGVNVTCPLWRLQTNLVVGYTAVPHACFGVGHLLVKRTRTKVPCLRESIPN